jgi:DNA repair protein RecO (recombination protein O)
MPLRRALSIVLRTYKVGESDKLVVFFTRDYGKIRGMARAARRPRSRFGASLEIGTEVELTFFEKDNRELVSVDRCDIVRSRFSKLGEPIAASTLGYVTDLVDNFALEREPNKHLYRLLRATVGAIADQPNCETRARYFEAWLLRLAGAYPRRKNCPGCGRSLADEGARYLASEQRLECQRCLGSGVSLSAAAVRFLEAIWKQPPESLAPPEAPSALRELGVFHYRLIQEQLEKDLKSHQVLEDMLRQGHDR